MFTRTPGPGRNILNRAVTISVLVLAFTPAPVSPAAADPDSDRSDAPTTGTAHPKGAAGVVSVKAYPGTRPAGVVTAEPGCPTPPTYAGYPGRMVCGYGYSALDWGGGNVEWFVVGTDFSIWHIWLNSGGWHSLGGLASAFAPNGAYPWVSDTEVGVWTIGAESQRRPWCNAWPWTRGWQLCTAIQPPPVLLT
jgi:hypothetical protein